MAMDKEILRRQAKAYGAGGRNCEERRRREKDFLKEAKKHENHQKTHGGDPEVRG